MDRERILAIGWLDEPAMKLYFEYFGDYQRVYHYTARVTENRRIDYEVTSDEEWTISENAVKGWIEAQWCELLDIPNSIEEFLIDSMGWKDFVPDLRLPGTEM
jgi:hypothetical protein